MHLRSERLRVKRTSIEGVEEVRVGSRTIAEAERPTESRWVARASSARDVSHVAKSRSTGHATTTCTEVPAVPEAADTRGMMT